MCTAPETGPPTQRGSESFLGTRWEAGVPALLPGGVYLFFKARSGSRAELVQRGPLMVSTMPFTQPGAATLFQNLLLIFWQPCANLFPVSGFPHVAGAGRSPHMWPFTSGPITDLLVCSAIFPPCVLLPRSFTSCLGPLTLPSGLRVSEHQAVLYV